MMIYTDEVTIYIYRLREGVVVREMIIIIDRVIIILPEPA